jgi:hypothetical protein
VFGYEELTDPERAVWEAVETGKLVDLRVGDPKRDDPAMGASWGVDRQVRAQLLYELLRGISKPEGTPPRALKLAGAWIIGALDLEAVTLLCPLLLRGCYVDQPISLEEASAPALRLPGCHVASLNADQLETGGSVELNDGFTASGEVRLIGARIKGQLDCSGATLTSSDKAHQPALNARGLTVDQGMFCTTGFTAEGEVRLAGAHISGQLDCSGAKMTNRGGRALNAGGLTVDQHQAAPRRTAVLGRFRVESRSGGELSSVMQRRAARRLVLDGCRREVADSGLAIDIAGDARQCRRFDG